jgi:thioredoxin-dependent peroxiredoxin
MKNFKLILLSILFTPLANSQSVKNFTLKSITDNSSFTLSHAKENYIALHFLLKTECPYCIMHTYDYIEKSKALQNVKQIFIKPDTENEIKEWALNFEDNNEFNFPIYQDKDAKLAKQFNIPNGYFFHGQNVHFPALILLNDKGEELFRYIGKNNSDRYPFKKFETLINKLYN